MDSGAVTRAASSRGASGDVQTGWTLTPMRRADTHRPGVVRVRPPVKRARTRSGIRHSAGLDTATTPATPPPAAPAAPAAWRRTATPPIEAPTNTVRGDRRA